MIQLGNSKFIQLQWNKFRITYPNYKLYIQFNVVIESNDLGLFRLSHRRNHRLMLMKKLEDEGYNSKEISELLNVNGIKPLRTKNPYTPKLVWVSLHKYQKRLDRIGNNRITQFKETLFVEQMGDED